MTRSLFAVLFLLIGFTVGSVTGYFAGKKQAAHHNPAYTLFSNQSRGESDATADSSSSRKLHDIPNREKRQRNESEKKGPRHYPAEEKIAEDNPFRNQKASEIIAFLNSSLPHSRGERFEQAMRMITGIVRNNPGNAGALLPTIRNGEVMHRVCRELAMHGGKDGVKTVFSFISSDEGSIATRGEAISALTSCPPELSSVVNDGFHELLTQFLPRELQHRLCHTYGEFSGEDAFTNLASLLNDATCSIKPDVIADTIGRFSRPENQKQLLDILEQGTWTRETQEGFLRALAQSNQNGNVLLDMLENPRVDISQRVVARSLREVADRGGLDHERLVNLMNTDLLPEVKRDLARALVKSGGKEGLASLMNLAAEENSGIDLNSLGAALAEAGGPDLVPAMVEMLDKVKSWDTTHHLARSIVESGGREGVEALLNVLEKGTLSEEQLRPMCEVLSDTATPADADRLFQHLAGAKGWEESLPLIESACRLSGNRSIEQCMDLVYEAESGEVRAAAAEMLRRKAKESAMPDYFVPDLLEALGSEESGRAQYHLAQAITMGADDGAKQLTEFFSTDLNDKRRHAILEAVGEMDAFENRSPFLSNTLLAENPPHIRIHAAKILAGIGDETAVKAIQQAVQDTATSKPANNEADFDLNEALRDCLEWAEKHKAGEKD